MTEKMRILADYADNTYSVKSEISVIQVRNPGLGSGIAASGNIMLTRLSMDELERSLSGPRPPKVIDVREAEEFARGHLKQAELIPLPALAKEIKKRIPNQHEAVVIYDDLGIRSHHAARLLRSMGYENVKEIWGGVRG